MHRLPNRQSVRLFRLAAYLLLLKWALIPGAFLLLCGSLFAGNRDLTHLAIALIGLAVPLTIVQWLAAARARCPLCIGLPLARKTCVLHRRARYFLGSYRLRIANSIAFRGYFCCPYCGESTAIEVRQRRR